MSSLNCLFILTFVCILLLKHDDIQFLKISFNSCGFQFIENICLYFSFMCFVDILKVWHASAVTLS